MGEWLAGGIPPLKNIFFLFILSFLTQPRLKVVAGKTQYGDGRANKESLEIKDKTKREHAHKVHMHIGLPAYTMYLKFGHVVRIYRRHWKKTSPTCSKDYVQHWNVQVLEFVQGCSCWFLLVNF
jgi:hypothetical protein